MFDKFVNIFDIPHYWDKDHLHIEYKFEGLHLNKKYILEGILPKQFVHFIEQELAD